MSIGVFLSRDGGAISDTVDVDTLAEGYSDLGIAKVYDSFFSYADQQDILKTVDENRLTEIVFAGNSPNFFRKVLNGTQILDALTSRGINASKIAFANIKEQVALPHAGEREKATKKARLLIDVALAKLDMAHDVKSIIVSPRRAVLIIGTTAGGIIAAQEMLKKGYRVYLIEKESSFRTQAGMEDDIQPTLSAVQLDNKSTILFETTVKDISGWCGAYTVILDTRGREEEITVGGILLAVGDDTELIKELKPKMQLDIDDRDLIRVQQGAGLVGRTGDPGIWFISSSNGNATLANEMSAASVTILSLTTILDQNEIQHPVLVSEVNESVCGGCGTCVKTCAFAASSIDVKRNVSTIDIARCQGCGNCVVACPTGARDLVTYPIEHTIWAIHMMARRAPDSSEPKVLALLGTNSGYLAADLAGELSTQIEGLRYSPNVLPMQFECGGSVDTQYVLEAFNEGFDGVVITICRDGHCHNVVGNLDMMRRLEVFREVLRSRNIDDKRLRIIQISPHEGKEFSQEIKAFCEELKSTSIVGVR